MKVKNEAELRSKLGLTIDPSDPTKAVPLNDNGKTTKSPDSGKKPFSVKGLPTPSWTEKQLVEGARYHWGQAQAFEKKAAVHVFRLGAALFLLKPLMKKRRKWGKFLKEMNLSSASAWRAMELFTRAKTENQVAFLTITDAYKKYGISIQAQIPADDDDAERNHAAEKGGKQKSAAKKVKAKKTLPKDAAEKDQEEAYEEFGQYDDDDDFGPFELFEEAAKRNGWDHQHQVQVLVEFWGQEIYEPLLRDAHKGEMKEFLAEQEKLPPPKEPTSPLSVLVMLRHRLEYMVEDIKAVDWKKGLSEDYRKLLDTIRQLVEQIGKGVPHE